jgi:hypothetical protein
MPGLVPGIFVFAQAQEPSLLASHWARIRATRWLVMTIERSAQ